MIEAGSVVNSEHTPGKAADHSSHNSFQSFQLSNPEIAAALPRNQMFFSMTLKKQGAFNRYDFLLPCHLVRIPGKKGRRKEGEQLSRHPRKDWNPSQSVNTMIYKGA